MTTRRQALNEVAARLNAAGVPDAALDAQWLLAHAAGVPRLALLTSLGEPVGREEAGRLAALAERRAAREPLQYVLGETDFMGRPFFTDSRALIPRCDTETLAEAALARLAALPAGPSLLDIGTGSGALAVTAALARPDARVTGVDISGEALALARENGARHGCRVEWIQSDLFSALPGRVFDVIVSNPPYIPTGDLGTLQAEVGFEPRLALDGGPDGLDFFRRVRDGLPGRLARGGALLLETGDGQARRVAALLAGEFKKMEVLRDLAGLCRVVAGDGYAG